MAEIEFFAAPEDLGALIDRLLQVTDFRIFETWSAFGQKPREFLSRAELEAFSPLGKDPLGAGLVTMLTLWSPSAVARRTYQRVALNPALSDGYTFRYSFLDPATPYLHLGGVHGKFITRTVVAHNSAPRPMPEEVQGNTDWRRFSELIKQLLRIVYVEVGDNMATTMMGIRRYPAVLPAACALHGHEGYRLVQNVHCNWDYGAPVRRKSRT